MMNRCAWVTLLAAVAVLLAPSYGVAQPPAALPANTAPATGAPGGGGLGAGANPFSANANPFGNNPFAAAQPAGGGGNNDNFAPQSQAEYDRLANTPDIFGDLFFPGGTVQISGIGGENATLDLPPAGGARIKISDFNKAITRDRVFVAYNHYHNAVTSQGQAGGESFATDFDVDRFIIGAEKEFHQGLFSFELRLPVSSSISINEGFAGASGGSVGNLGVIGKLLLFAVRDWSCVAGCGLSLPTGGDSSGFVFDSPFVLRNEAVHLLPYTGLMYVNGPFFSHGFGQLDIPLNSNSIDVSSNGFDPAVSGSLKPQTLMLLDLVAGMWLYRNRLQRFFSGVAASVELHYTHALEDTGSFNVAQQTENFNFSNGQNRIDYLNFTAGVTVQLTPLAALQVGYTTPLNNGDRSFDGEAQAAISSRY